MVPSLYTPIDPFYLLPLVAAMSIDHFTSSGSAAPDNITTGSAVPSDAPSIAPYVAPSGEQFGSPSGPSSSLKCHALSSPALDLCVDLSSYSFPQQPIPNRSAAPVVSTIWCCVPNSPGLPI